MTLHALPRPDVLLDERDTLAWRLCEADLVSGAIELSELARDGIPPARQQNFPEPPVQILERLFAAVAPTDLTRMGGGIWIRAQRSWRKHGVISWDHIRSGTPEATRGVTRFYEDYGMGLGLQAPVAAERLLQLRAALARGIVFSAGCGWCRMTHATV
jgi:hypothetical protein